MPIQDPVARLEQFPLFSGFSPESLRLIGDLMEERACRVREVLFHQGEPPSHVYLVESGEVLEVGTGPGAAVALRLQAQPGAVLGRWSVYNGDPHRTTATVVQSGRVLALPMTEFRPLLGRFASLRERLGRSGAVGRLRAIPLFSALTEDQLFHVADLAEIAEFAAGEVIFRQGDAGDAFYVIDTGRVVEEASTPPFSSSSWPKYFTAGSFFGRHALLKATTRRATARAETAVRAFRFGLDAFRWLRRLHRDLDRNLQRFDMLACLGQAPLFSRLDEADLKLLAGYVGLAHFPKDQVLAYQGEIDPAFFQLYEGEAVEYARDERGKDRPAGTLAAGQGVGERCLFFEEAWETTVRTVTESNWLYLCRPDLDQLLARRPDLKRKLVPPSRLAAAGERPPFLWMALDEQEMLRSRRHWISLLGALLGWPRVLWLIAGAGLIALGAVIRTGWPLEAIGWPVLALRLLWCIVDWANDHLVITTKRVVVREKVILLFESLFEVPLAKVQNVGYIQDFFGNLLHYGRLTVDTAATSGVQPLTFAYMPRPDGARALIFEEMARKRAARLPQARREIRERIVESTQAGIRHTVPKPVAPAAPSQAVQRRAGILVRAFQATLGRWFWIELAEGERVTWRKHPLRLLVKVWMPTLCVAALAALYRLLSLPPLLFWPFLPPLLFWWWWGWADWGNDLYIVTPDRVIDTERLPLGFRSKRTEAPFDRIQNVTYELPNLIANLFNFGTVSIHTAGVEGKLDFPYVRGPRKVQAEIFRRLEAYEETQRQKQQAPSDLGEWFAAYEQTR